jgi:hypothetical protein
MTDLVQFNLWHQLLIDAFDDLGKAIYKQPPKAEASPELIVLMDAFQAYVKGDYKRLTATLCHRSLFRIFPN